MTFYDVFRICGACWHCLVAKAGTRCPTRRVYGITTSADEGLLGGWTERIEIKPGVRVLPLPEGVDVQDFMGGGCGLPTGFHAVERAGIALGDTVVVQGSGPVGLSALVFAQLAGASRVLVVGAPRERLQAARRLGAEDTLDVLEETDPAARVRFVRERTSGRGADVVIEASGNPQAVVEGLDDGARRGTLRGGRPVHRRGRRHPEPAPAPEPQARDPARLLGLRVHPSPSRRSTCWRGARPASPSAA